MMTKRLSPKAIQALKEAVASVYWTKKDLRGFLTHSIADARILARVDWTQTKKDIAALVVDQLVARPDQRNLYFLVDEVSKMTDFSHLDDDGAARARKAIQALRDMTRTHEDAAAEQQRRAARQQAVAHRVTQRETENTTLAALLTAFTALLVAPDAQRRGYELERLLNNLFTLAKLDPKASFRLAGEQIDGAFTLDGDARKLAPSRIKNRGRISAAVQQRAVAPGTRPTRVAWLGQDAACAHVTPGGAFLLYRQRAALNVPASSTISVAASIWYVWSYMRQHHSCPPLCV